MFENPTDQILEGEIYNLYGELVEKVKVGANTIVKLPVPQVGMLHIR